LDAALTAWCEYWGIPEVATSFRLRLHRAHELWALGETADGARTEEGPQEFDWPWAEVFIRTFIEHFAMHAEDAADLSASLCPIRRIATAR
jgi:hypothetical protein